MANKGAIALGISAALGLAGLGIYFATRPAEAKETSGEYTDIVELSPFPAKPSAGEGVIVSLVVKNITKNAFKVRTGGGASYIAGTQNYLVSTSGWDPSYADMQPGQTVLFRTAFTMPQHQVTMEGTVYWLGSDGQYHKDGDITIVIPLA